MVVWVGVGERAVRHYSLLQPIPVLVPFGSNVLLLLQRLLLLRRLHGRIRSQHPPNGQQDEMQSRVGRSALRSLVAGRAPRPNLLCEPGRGMFPGASVSVRVVCLGA